MIRTGATGSGHTGGTPTLELPRDEMAFRLEYEPLMRARTLITVFRPGNRLWPNWRGYQPGEIVTGRVIARPGSDALGIPPQFTPARFPIQIGTINVMAPDALTPDDFFGSSPDVQDVPALLDHLMSIYGKPLSAFDDLVTRITFTYLDPA